PCGEITPIQPVTDFSLASPAMAVCLPSYQPNARPHLRRPTLREDDMRRKHIPTVLLLAACAAVGCSKAAEAPEARTQQLPVPAPKPAPVKPEAIDQETGQGVGEVAPTKITGPVSFADADAAFQAKNYNEAVTLFEAYTEQRPRNPCGHFLLGLSASKAGDAAARQGGATADGCAGIPQQSRDGTRAHRTLSGRRGGVPRRVDGRPWLREGEAEPGARRSRQSGGRRTI